MLCAVGGFGVSIGKKVDQLHYTLCHSHCCSCIMMKSIAIAADPGGSLNVGLKGLAYLHVAGVAGGRTCTVAGTPTIQGRFRSFHWEEVPISVPSNISIHYSESGEVSKPSEEQSQTVSDGERTRCDDGKNKRVRKKSVNGKITK